MYISAHKNSVCRTIVTVTRTTMIDVNFSIYCKVFLGQLVWVLVICDLGQGTNLVDIVLIIDSIFNSS